MSWAALFLAAALLVGTDSRPRVRARLTAEGPPRGRNESAKDDPLATASSLDVFAACLRSGMAVSTAASATAPSAPAPLARVLNRAADLLALGAEPATAWTTSGGAADNGALAVMRLARRSASSGTALAQGVAELADHTRHEAMDAAGAAAERASVLIAGPLGLCYLPAFVCLGVVPVVVGLAGDVLRSGIL
jgi:pilus assembly protein TadC